MLCDPTGMLLNSWWTVILIKAGKRSSRWKEQEKIVAEKINAQEKRGAEEEQLTKPEEGENIVQDEIFYI